MIKRGLQENRFTMNRKLQLTIFLITTLHVGAFVPFKNISTCWPKSDQRNLLHISTRQYSTRDRRDSGDSLEDGEPIHNFDFDPELAVSVAKGLWYLPVLSVLSGFTPASRIIAESHVSRMPDSPIAHDIDTFLLWPYGGSPGDGSISKTIFKVPEAAITDPTMYDVDWDAVKATFVMNVGMSLIYSSLIAFSLYYYIANGKDRE